ncbi:EF-hand domain-containing protein [Pseudooceanicola sp. LIPI14-2-Ac024]|uniref:EF-hand domain-containing protein n=1 Tax=Pseudooceanicola sp. LIPI14-2-Ac024 TaxID=3344875 RepID=UPI0035CF573D
MNRKMLMSGAMILAVAAGAVSAQEQQENRGPRPDFATIDTDGDGQVSPEEMRAHAAARFAGADADNDGVITADEMIAHMEAREEQRKAERRQRMVERMLERADDDGDGALSIDELLPPERTQDRMFKRLDADGDGVISEEEFAKMAEMRGPRGGGDRGERGHGDRHHGPREGRMERPFGFEHRDGKVFKQNAPERRAPGHD